MLWAAARDAQRCQAPLKTFKANSQKRQHCDQTSWLPNLDEPGFLDGVIVRSEQQVVNTRRSNDHAVSRITVEARREIIDGDNGIGIQREDLEHIGRGRAPEPGWKRNG